MKFIHTSDWHIGRQFHNTSLLDDQRHVLLQIIDYIVKEQVDALVISGDIYDRSLPPSTAVEMLDEVFQRIVSDLKVPVILIPGNHDGAERLGFGARLMHQSGLHIISKLNDVTNPVILNKDGIECAFYGIPYCEPLMVKNEFDVDVKTFDQAHTYLVNKISEQKSEKQTNVLISHCFIDGAQESESERPLQVGGADRVSYQPCIDFDYVALGHLHSPQYRGAEHIRYSGSILKYSFSEQHQKKGVSLVEISASGLASQRDLPLIPLKNMRVIEGKLDQILEQGKLDPYNEDYILVRLTDTRAILEPMAKLREVYPNVLHLEKLRNASNNTTKLSRAELKKGELEMFNDFYLSVMDEAMNKEQQCLLSDIIEDLHKQ